MEIDVFFLRRVRSKTNPLLRAYLSVRVSHAPGSGITLHGVRLLRNRDGSWWIGFPARKSGAIYEPYVTMSSDLREEVTQAAVGKYAGKRGSSP